MANKTLTGTNASYLLSSSLYTLTNLGVVGSGSVAIGLTVTGTSDTIVNSGTITGSTFGISASHSLSITNSGTGSLIIGSGANGTGIKLAAGGDVTNFSGGTISGYSGISAAAAATVVNAGLIKAGQTSGGANGIALSAGGTVTNQAGGSITATTGIRISGATGSVVNLGQIISSYGRFSGNVGVYLANGGRLVNGVSGGTVSSAYIAGYGGGVKFGATGTATFVNYGVVYGQGGQAVVLTNGTVINGLSGATAAQIKVGGNRAIDISGAGTVVNYGTISVAGGNGADYYGVFLRGSGIVSNLGTKALITGYNGAIFGAHDNTVITGGTLAHGDKGNIAVRFGTGTNRLIINPGAVFSGQVTAAGTSTMELASGATTGTISGLGISASFTGFPQITVDSGARWVLSGSNTFGSGLTLTDSGTLSVTGTLVNSILVSGASRGLVLGTSGRITNQSGGTIVGGAYGIVSSGAGTVTNAGSIGGNTANGIGVYLSAGGTVTNQAGGLISGGAGAVYFGSGRTNRLVVVPSASFTGTVNGGNIIGAASISSLELASSAAEGTISGLGSKYVNFARVTIDSGATWTLSGTSSGFATLSNLGKLQSGVTLGSGSFVVSNTSTGTISSASTNALYASGALAVTNAGSIGGGTGIGVYLAGGGTLTNQATGKISGGANAVKFGTSHSNKLVIAPTASFTGIVDGGNTIGAAFISTLELTTSGTGSLSGLGSQFINFAQVTVDNGATWTLSGTSTGFSSLTNAGKLQAGVVLGSSSFTVSNASTGTISNTVASGTALVAGGALAVTNAGSIGGGAATGIGVYLAGGGTLTNLATSKVSGGADAVKFGASRTNRLVVTPSASFTGTVDGGNTIGAGSVSTMELASSASVGTLNGVGIQFVNFAQVTIDSGAKWTLSGAASLLSGATLTNSGTLTASGTLTNAGAISGTTNAVILGSGAALTNQSGGTIIGSVDAVSASSAAVVVNAGSIGGGTSSGIGVYLGGGGTLTNQVGGAISGGAHAVKFGAAHTNRLMVAPSASFTGTVDGGNTIGAASISTLELISSASAGTLHGFGSQYVNFAQTMIDSGANWTLVGTNTIAAGATITNAGTLVLSDATLADAGGLVNNSGILLDSSTVTIAGLVGTGSTTINTGSTLDVQGTISSGQTITFIGGGAYLHLENPGSIAGSVTNFDGGDTIDLAAVDPGSVSYGAGRLTIGAGQSFAFTLADTATLQVSASADGAALTALCFCAETRIATPLGEVAVEKLSAGDLVLTASGEVRPLVWVGTGRVMVTRGHRSAATPVIVRKSALGENVPNFDLRVTKGHSFLIDDVLIPVEFLVNHCSILWDDQAKEVSIYHLELGTHDILVANGAPAESYRDDGNRWLFENGNTGWEQPPKPPCAPVLTGGPIVDAIWRGLLERADPGPSLPLTDDPDLHLLVDGVRVNGTRNAKRYMFRLGHPPDEVRVMSRAGSPEELRQARDPRVLGVAIRQVRLWRGVRLLVIDASDPALTDGFHAFEADNRLRWTNGDGVLPPALFAGVDGPCELELRVGGTTLYPLFKEAGGRVAA
jgi:fibronectin-binding autotransporter adhesin